MVIAEKRLQVALHEVHREIFAEQELEAYCEARVAGHQRHLCAWDTTRYQCTNERINERTNACKDAQNTIDPRHVSCLERAPSVRRGCDWVATLPLAKYKPEVLGCLTLCFEDKFRPSCCTIR